MNVTALIPIYKNAKRAADIALVLSAEGRPGSRIALVVDGEVNPEMEAELARVRELPSVTVIEGRPHLGKAAALNQAVAGLPGEALLFFDNDIELPEGRPFLALTEALLADREMAELPKVGRGKGLVAAMGIYEFMSNVIATEYLVGRTGRMPSLNGAAFAVKRGLFEKLGGFRPVLNEDMDFAARAFLEGGRFGFDPVMTVGNAVPASVEEWLRQRRRWSLNSALWSVVYMERIMDKVPEMRPTLGVSGLIFPLPFLALLAGALIPGLLAGAFSAGPEVAAAASLAGAALAFLPVARLFRRKSRAYGSRFGLPSFFLYSLAYLPIWGLASLTGIIIVATGKLPDLDWKHDRGEVEAELESLGGPRRPVGREGLGVAKAGSEERP